MSTFATMKTRIADEIARTDLTSQINLAVLDAVKHYDRRRWWFQQNEISLTMTAGQSRYTSSDDSDIPNIRDFEYALVTDTTGGWGDPLSKVTYAALAAELEDDSQTLPEYYAYWRESIYIGPVPSAGYICKFGVILSLTDLSADEDTNAWMTSGEQLIRYRAKGLLYAEVIRHYENALAMQQLEIQALKELQAENDKRIEEAPARMDEVAAMARRGRYNIYGDTYSGLGR